MENLTPRWEQSGLFFPKYGHSCRFSEKGLSLPTSCTPAMLTKHLTIANLDNHSKKQQIQLPRTILQK